jgi:adenine-specific DNA methylase
MDPLCGEDFRRTARRHLRELGLYQDTGDENRDLRKGLIELVAVLSEKKIAEDIRFLRPARELIVAGAKETGGAPPLVLADPFAGGGAIPVEGLRMGVRAIASDLNPVPVMLNRLLVDAVPKFGAARIASLISTAAREVEAEALRVLRTVHPGAKDEIAIAYLWARTIRCEGPACGIDLPLIRSWWLDKKSSKKVHLGLRVKSGSLEFYIADGGKMPAPIMKAGAATCPSCGYSTANPSVRAQLAKRRGGAADARLLAVVVTDMDGRGRRFRLPSDADASALKAARTLLSRTPREALPTERVSSLRPSPNARGLSAVTRIGVEEFRDLFSERQSVCLVTFVDAIRRTTEKLSEKHEERLVDAVALGLAAALGRCTDHWNSCCTWNATGLKLQGMFKRQAIPVVWDFCEANPFGGSVGSWLSAVECVGSALKNASFAAAEGEVLQTDAGKSPLPDDAVDILFTDPPYYDSVPYADLSDFFYVWERRVLGGRFPALFGSEMTPKDEEAIWNPSRIHRPSNSAKDKTFFEEKMRQSLAEARRVTKPNGIGIVVFAHKSTEGWEAILSALVDAGWVATASWPLDTELGTRMNAMGTASLASSIHIVCRPREDPDGSVRTDDVGDWREVLRELPRRIHEWMPRLAEEGVVGADAIFSCLGPALEVFSRYSRVEKTSGEVVTLKEYLEHVWAAVSKEALSMIFRDPETAGLEPDARLTAMWLWTLAGPSSAEGAVPAEGVEADDEGEDDDDGASQKRERGLGFTLEFDAARKIAQGLGATLENLTSVVEVKADKARLLSVAERARSLFAKSDVSAPVAAKKAAKKQQLKLFEEEIESAAEEQGWDASGAPTAGKTALDRVHQAMLLFGTGRSEALKRFLVEEGAGRQASFWKLAQALSALYPPGCDEKRWVDGVLARKKSLGF